MWFLFSFAVLIIGALSVYAGYLLKRVRAVEQKKQDDARIQQEKDDKRIEYITESLRVISLNVLEEGLNLSEATIRCKHLLDGLFLPIEHREKYALLDEVFEQIKDFATHKARRDLPKTELRQQDKAREEIEGQYRADLLLLFREMRTFAMPVIH